MADGTVDYCGSAGRYGVGPRRGEGSYVSWGRRGGEFDSGPRVRRLLGVRRDLGFGRRRGCRSCGRPCTGYNSYSFTCSGHSSSSYSCRCGCSSAYRCSSYNYNAAAGQPPTANLASPELAGLTLVAGVYRLSTAQLTGDLTLNGQGASNGVWIF